MFTADADRDLSVGLSRLLHCEEDQRTDALAI